MPSMKKIERMNDHALLVELVKQQKRTASRVRMTWIFLAILVILLAAGGFFLVPKARETFAKADASYDKVGTAAQEVTDRMPAVDTTLTQAQSLMTDADKAVGQAQALMTDAGEAVTEARNVMESADTLLTDADRTVTEVGDLVIANRGYVEASVQDGYRVMEILAAIFGKKD